MKTILASIFVLLVMTACRCGATTLGDFFANIKLSTPQDLSAEIGMILGNSHGSSSSDGIVLSVEPGLKGVKGHIGYGMFGNSYIPTSGRLTATYFLNEDSEHYAGVEYLFSLCLCCINVGVLQAFGKNDTICTAGIGFGF